MYAEPNSLRQTTSGKVVGFVGDYTSHVWLGIPYAEPPVGKWRWRAPRPFSSEVDTREALSPGSPACQPGIDGDTRGSEDCLYLNIWSPQFTADQIPSGDQQLPVMVWLHGGSSVYGNGFDYSNGALLATEQQVIVVSINYRLGIFGWFSHPILRNHCKTAEERSGNFGMLDHILALKWIRHNIAAFGGDARNVTIMGESSGADHVFNLMLSPLAKGLFHKAIAMSGDPITERSFPVAIGENLIDDNVAGHSFSSGELLLQLVQLDGHASGRQSAKDYLKNIDESAIFKYFYRQSYFAFHQAKTAIISSCKASALAPGSYSIFPRYFRDGLVLPSEEFLSVFSRGDYHQVPLIMGTTKDEDKISLFFDPCFTDTVDGGQRRIKDKKLFNLACEYLSKILAARGVDELAEAMEPHQPDQVFACRFDWAGLQPLPGPDEMDIGAPHGIDVPALFGNSESLKAEKNNSILTKFVDRSCEVTFQEVSRSMRAYYTAFAYEGSPGRGRANLPEWSPWRKNNSQPNLLLLAANTDVGLRMVHRYISRNNWVEALATDSRLDSPEEKCEFLWYLLHYQGLVGRLNDQYYYKFLAGSCIDRSPLNWCPTVTE